MAFRYSSEVATPAKASNDLLSRSVSTRNSVKGLSSASAIRSIIRKDGLPLSLDKFEINEVRYPDIFESHSYLTAILIKHSKDIGKEYVVIH